MKKANSEALFAMGAFALALIIAVVYLFVRYNTVNESEMYEVLPDNCYAETIIAVADIDYEPFSFLDEEGTPRGYDIELLYAIANRMDVNVEIRLMNWTDCNMTMEKGEADVIAGLDFKQTGYPGIILSNVVNDDSYVCFGKTNLNRAFDLYGKRIAALEQSSSITDCIEPYQLTDQTSLYPTYTEVMQSVISGENDYAIARYSVGRRVLAKLNETEVHAVGPTLANNIVCIGINDQKPHLADLFNEVVSELTKDGTIEKLSQKWLGTYVELIDVNDFLRIHSSEIFIITEILVVLFVVMAFIIYRSKVRVIQAGQDKQIKEKELELTESRIAIMLSQIQPHFIYNALVAIQELCRINPKSASEAVGEFSHYLRGNLDSLSLKRPIPFQNELRHVETYLSLEKRRFDKKLTIVYDIKADGFFIPALTLQPIVENAVHHGVTKREDGGTVIIGTSETDTHSVINVIDNGVGFALDHVSEQSNRLHVGIHNVRSRIESMSGGTLDIVSYPGIGTTATIRIPKGGTGE